MWSVASRDLDLIPTNKGLPRRVATHSPGKWTLLKHSEKAPSCLKKKINFEISNEFYFFALNLKCSYQLLNDLLHQFPEGISRMLRVDMLNELGNDFSVGLRFKLVSLVFQKLLDVLVVGDDSCYFNFITNVNLKTKNKTRKCNFWREYRCGRQWTRCSHQNDGDESWPR